MTPIQTATKATRATIKRVLGSQTGITVKSSTSYDVVRRVDTLVTTISYPAGTRYEDLGAALLPSAISVVLGEYAMTVIRAA